MSLITKINSLITRIADEFRKRDTFVTLDATVAQTIDVSTGHNALCNTQLAGDATFLLSNLTKPCTGVIDIAEQTTQRALSIIAEDLASGTIPVLTQNGAILLTLASSFTSIAWEYNGAWVNVNFLDYK